MSGCRAAVHQTLRVLALAVVLALGAVPTSGLGAPPVVHALSHGYNAPMIARVFVDDVKGAEAGPVQVRATWEGSASPSVEARGTSTTLAARSVATNTAIGFTDDAVGTAYQGMRSGGGHAMRHLMDEGLIPNSGSLASRASLFEDLTSPILTDPAKTFDWKLGNTATRAFAGEAGGRQVVVFVAKEGPYQGKVLSAVVPDAGQITQWGL
jgi:hypothetical protein